MGSSSARATIGTSSARRRARSIEAARAEPPADREAASRGLRRLHRALALRPGDPHILAALRTVHLGARRYATGIADGEASLARDPDQPALCNHLAWIYVTGPTGVRDPSRAIPLARRAVELGPATATYHDTLGVVLYRLGRWREAVTELEASLAGQPRTYGAFDLYFLALCHHRPGDTSRAKVCLERALRLHSDAQLPSEVAEELRSFRDEAAAAFTSPPSP